MLILINIKEYLISHNNKQTNLLIIFLKNKYHPKLLTKPSNLFILYDNRYDSQFKNFISDFNKKHKGQVSLLDFSNYATTFGELKDGPIKKSDLDIIQEFQKRKIDQRIHNLRIEKLKSEPVSRSM